MQVEKDVIYDSAYNLAADLYVPDEANGGAIVYAHGGGWFRGDKENESDLGKYFADAGYLFAIPSFRLAPKYLYPTAQNDFDHFINWLLASPYDFDRERLGLLGASSGGTMVLQNSLASGYPLVAWSPVVDFANWVQKNQMVKASVDGKKELGLTEIHEIHDSFYKFFVQTYLGGLDPRLLTAVNPTNHLTDQLGPALLFNSADELMPLPSALHFLQQAAMFGRDIGLHVVPGTGHARDYTSFALPETKRFFDHHLFTTVEDKTLNKATD
ncbi:alpha/beta hydrolase [Lacticaseibacillus paracasei]|uniref:Esterase/lipase n=3 Tax=Lacticaseibacillus paracasei TaxID=1597 RepID=A0A829H5J7_LACPA|nr:alpha/beta hydrolase [Lacticaseibacillus paracasei]EKQ20815.1 esterase/lipase [Lacticaseibacillus casei UW4]EPC31280.1 esterase/lipase [Lacticaseibacillus paracasei subsp. paracasei Lpp22]EPC70720.1 Esterase/lipase [Lacticaseibacillus paracasei subsp. paracasei Lpp41]AKU35089.1 esterase [Lacticaseibacillus paracasei]ATG99225.1 esterase [Lacticaseibacillus paracasei]